MTGRKYHSPRDTILAHKWPDDMVEFLRAEVKLGHSNGVISRAINAETGLGQRWAKLRKTPSAVGGKIDRLGIADERPANLGRPKVRKERRVHARPPRMGHRGIKPVRDPRMEAAVRLGELQASRADEPALRDEGDRGSLPSAPPARNPGGNSLINGRPPYLPDISEASATAMEVKDADHAICMWPASKEVKDMKVCGAKATIGSYCDHHATLAYRIMPTRRRNAGYHKPNEDWKIGNPKVEQG